MIEAGIVVWEQDKGRYRLTRPAGEADLRKLRDHHLPPDEVLPSTVTDFLPKEHDPHRLYKAVALLRHILLPPNAPVERER